MSKQDLTQNHLKLIETADILIGGKRQLAFFPKINAEKKTISHNLADLLSYIKKWKDKKKIVVLASGDALFYGIGKRLIEAFGTENLIFYPNITSVAAAFSKIKVSWDDVKIISLHARGSLFDIVTVLESNKKVAVLTDKQNTPSKIAEILIQNNIQKIDFWVFERMGHKDEYFQCYDLEDASKKKFAEPNFVICILKEDIPKDCKVFLGMPDDYFYYEKNMITKSEIRVLTLSKLNLQNKDVLWDLGAGCGSVSVEASYFIKEGRIIAVEKNSARIKLIEKNKEHFKIKQLEIVQNILPNNMSDLPDPDCIFVGGGGKNLAEIIIKSIKRLKAQGIIVVNVVLLESLFLAYKTLKDLGLELDITQIQVNKNKMMPGKINRMKALNPVWIIKGTIV